MIVPAQLGTDHPDGDACVQPDLPCAECRPPPTGQRNGVRVGSILAWGQVAPEPSPPPGKIARPGRLPIESSPGRGWHDGIRPAFPAVRIPFRIPCRPGPHRCAAPRKARRCLPMRYDARASSTCRNTFSPTHRAGHCRAAPSRSSGWLLAKVLRDGKNRG